MNRSISFSLAGLLAASALAAVVVTVGSNGRGRAETSDGRRGSFDYEVAKRIEGDQAPLLRGRFRFEQQANARGPYVLIEMNRLDGLGIAALNSSVCEFTGRGVLVRLDGGRRIATGGRLDVRVEDRRTPAKPLNERDKFRVRFTPERGLPFAFDGLVTDGDLAVFRR